ncbi:MAG TPA: FAD/NAD(P)-binding protein, partial [Methylocystis sp.]|nr:FAD/NAD(P)-binding protein [Methylocystis sp.]
MDSRSTQSSSPSGNARTYDVVIVGGGSGGVAAASSLLKRRPKLSIAVVEPSDT